MMGVLEAFTLSGFLLPPHAFLAFSKGMEHSSLRQLLGGEGIVLAPTSPTSLVSPRSGGKMHKGQGRKERKTTGRQEKGREARNRPMMGGHCSRA